MSVAVDKIEYYTYDDYREWEGDWELIDGIAFAMAPSPIKNHQAIQAAIIAQLYTQIEDRSECEVLGEFDYKVSDDTVLKPDIILSCNDSNQHYLLKAPEIIVEIVSKSTARRDEKFKFEIYEQEGVKYYILVYPNDMRAKIYKLKSFKYEKVGDFTDEIYQFEDTLCKVSLDFGRVFRRVNKK